jgi:hypothetical protein
LGAALSPNKTTRAQTRAAFAGSCGRANRTRPGLLVHLPNGARLKFSDASQIPLAVTLIRALEKSR